MMDSDFEQAVQSKFNVDNGKETANHRAGTVMILQAALAVTLFAKALLHPEEVTERGVVSRSSSQVLIGFLV